MKDKERLTLRAQGIRTEAFHFTSVSENLRKVAAFDDVNAMRAELMRWAEHLDEEAARMRQVADDTDESAKTARRR